MTYPKIETLYDRDEQFKVDPERIRRAEFDLPKRWLVTEKIDGTNVRVLITMDEKGGLGSVRYEGRTDAATMPPFLTARLEELFNETTLDGVFDPMIKAILYGEGYGEKIQKGGGNYRKGVSFRLIDVLVIGSPEQSWWLEWENVEDVARKIGIETVPVLLHDATLHEAVDAVTDPSLVAFQDSGTKDYVQEGIVARTVPQLFDRRGHRVAWKLKGKDFARGIL